MCVTACEQLVGRRLLGARGVDAVVGPLRRAARRVLRRGAAARRAGAVGGGRRDARLGALRRRRRRASTASARRRRALRCSTSSGSTPTTSSNVPSRCSTAETSRRLTHTLHDGAESTMSRRLMTSAIAKLNDYGQSPWYDNLSRTLLQGGGLAKLVSDDGMRGRHVEPDDPRQGDRRRRGLRRAAAAVRGRRACRSKTPTGPSCCATSSPPPTCCDRCTTRPAVLDGFVSVEVSPELAHDTDGTEEAARVAVRAVSTVRT